MDKMTLFLRLQKLEDTKKNIKETVDIINISKALFLKEISVLEKKLREETDKDARRKIRLYAEKIYKDYQNSLFMVEEFIEEISKKLNSNIKS